MTHFKLNTYFSILTCVIGQFPDQYSDSEFVGYERGGVLEFATHPLEDPGPRCPGPTCINKNIQDTDYNTETDQYGVYNSYGQEETGPSASSQVNPWDTDTNGNPRQCIHRIESVPIDTLPKINGLKRTKFVRAWGCQGNTKTYQDKKECDTMCIPGPATDPNEYCLMPEDPGMCRAFQPMWFWDPTIRRCRPFGFGGCGGNKNRFGSEQDCLKACQGTNAINGPGTWQPGRLPMDIRDPQIPILSRRPMGVKSIPPTF